MLSVLYDIDNMINSDRGPISQSCCRSANLSAEQNWAESHLKAIYITWQFGW